MIWESAALEQNRPPTKKGGRGANQPITTYFGPRAMISFDIYKKSSKKKELLDFFLRTPLPFPSLISALRTVCPKGGHRSRQRPGTCETHLHQDEPDSIDSFFCHLYECALNASQQRHPSFRKQSSFSIFGNQLSKKKSGHIRFSTEDPHDSSPEIFRQPSHGFDEMVISPHFISMKVNLDDICAFVSTQHEIQSRLRGELIDQSSRHDQIRKNRPPHGNAN